MHKNLLWQAFLLLIFLIAFIYTAIALYRWYGYSRLQATAVPLQITWEVKERSADNYFIQATYQFQVDGKLFSGETAWPDEYYFNAWAAEKAIEDKRKLSWKIWYDPAHPDYSSLQKNFPLKQCAAAAFLWLLAFYFLGLGYYVSKYKS